MFVIKLREDVQKGVYVENLSEFEVHTVSDILKLLIQVPFVIVVFHVGMRLYMQHNLV